MVCRLEPDAAHGTVADASGSAGSSEDTAVKNPPAQQPASTVTTAVTATATTPAQPDHMHR